jgi:hypothetical protein
MNIVVLAPAHKHKVLPTNIRNTDPMARPNESWTLRFAMEFCPQIAVLASEVEIPNDF